MQAGANLAASLLALGQTLHMLRAAAARPKRALWALCLLPLAPWLANVYAIRASTASLLQANHPVEALAQAAEAAFEAMLARQSPNYTAAEQEYRRRYAMGPPAGFQAWYDYAVARQSPIIDDFDMIHEAVAPLLAVSGQRLREATDQASDADMWTCAFRAATGETQCWHAWRTYDRHIQQALGAMLGDAKGVLPDVEFLVNHLDEPRVMLPRDRDSARHAPVAVTDLSRRPIWDTLTRNCPPRANGTRSRGLRSGGGVGGGVDTHGVPFVTDVRTDKDLCQHGEYSDMHGLALSPVSFVLVEGPVAVLSTGAPSTMGDVLFPSPAYVEGEFAYNEAGDVAWEQKHNNLYWAGSTTGGYASDGDGGEAWRRFHRQRFVALAQGLAAGSSAAGSTDKAAARGHGYTYLGAGGDGRVRATASGFLNRHLWDVSFTRIFQCQRAACGAQRTHFEARPWADKDAALRSRLVFDTDGNGISGRFGKLLASRSVPLKQTLLREWHDERLAAWVHYVPVSQAMGELPELVAWLTGSETGRARARRVAEAGRAWAGRAMRAEDRAVYACRLMLELARALDPEREAVDAGGAWAV